MSCVLISGEIGAGKSAVAKQLAPAIDAAVVSVRQALLDVLGLHQPDRRTLQDQGARLDRQTRGRWLLEYLDARLEIDPGLIVDSVRTRRQTLPILEVLSDSFLVYLDAGRETRARRFASSARTDLVKRSMSFEDASRHPTERAVGQLRSLATLVLPTEELSVAESVAAIVDLIAGRRDRS